MHTIVFRGAEIDMSGEDQEYSKFPCILKNKLLSGEIKFPDRTQFKYEDIFAFRAVEREEGDDRPVNRDDFKSYFELGKTPKARGVSKDWSTDPTYYGVSCFTNRKHVEQLMKFPNPNKKMASGFVYSAGGPSYVKHDHICWWLYIDAEIEKNWNLDSL